MPYSYKSPIDSLSTIIRTVLILEGNAAPGDSTLPLFTNGMPALLCRIEKNEYTKDNSVQLTLFGKSTPSDSWETSPGTMLIAYFFKPFSMAPLFNMSANRLKEGAIDLSEFDPHINNSLRMQFSHVATVDQSTAILNNFLQTQLQQQQSAIDIIHYATDTMIRDADKDVLAGILTHLQLNERTFQRVFKKYVGITPTQFRRICQFQVSFAQLRAGEFDNITEVVYDNGFADQSHFIRAFKEYTKTTPQQYLRHGLKDKKS